MIRQTHTYVTLEISDEAYQEIRSKLDAAGYQHTFMPGGEIDLSGIAVKSDGVDALELAAMARGLV